MVPTIVRYVKGFVPDAHLYSTMAIIEMCCYNKDFRTVKYFISTRETAFEIALLHQLDAEVLIIDWSAFIQAEK